jgi:DnaJ-class molecular chaperone
MGFWWKCPECHGTGRVFSPWYAKTSESCLKCDGTGNAVVNGEEERHRRRLLDEQIDKLVNHGVKIHG